MRRVHCERGEESELTVPRGEGEVEEEGRNVLSFRPISAFPRPYTGLERRLWCLEGRGKRARARKGRKARRACPEVGKKGGRKGGRGGRKEDEELERPVRIPRQARPCTSGLRNPNKSLKQAGKNERKKEYGRKRGKEGGEKDAIAPPRASLQRRRARPAWLGCGP
jgi:hypothetical protein